MMMTLSKSGALSIALTGIISLSPAMINSTFAEVETTSEVSPEHIAGETYSIHGMNIVVRDKNGKRLGVLRRNDKVKFISYENPLGEDRAEVKIVRSEWAIDKAENYYISKKYMKSGRGDFKYFDGKYFVIQNLATERLRVYEKSCSSENICSHKMVFETEMVVGESDGKKGTRTYVGSYRISDWVKFYEDGKGHYPAWYKDGYPAVPSPDEGALAWFKKKYMPEAPYVTDSGEKKFGRHGDMRGAFGWYAALVTPNHNSQWTHGTIGWGENKDQFIKRTKKFWANVFADPRSAGCSRLNNEAIAYLREMLPIGTPMIKIYAREALQDPTKSRYTQQNSFWDYILTKERTPKAYSIDREKVIERGALSEELERGTFKVDMVPDIIKYTPKKKLFGFKGKVKNYGNVYKVKEEFMKGVYLVDTGLLVGYQHPIDPKNVAKDKKRRAKGKKPKHQIIIKGGFADEIAPSYVIANPKNIDLTGISYENN